MLLQNHWSGALVNKLSASQRGWGPHSQSAEGVEFDQKGGIEKF